MKKLFLLNIMLATILSMPAHSAPIQVYATNVDATYGNFSAAPGGTVLGSDSEVQSIIASDASTAIFGSSATDYSVIDLSFGNDVTVLTGAGADLVLFSLWRGSDYIIGLEAYGIDSISTPISSFNYPINTCSDTNEYSDCASGVSALSIDLFHRNDLALALDDGIEISFLRLFIGGDFYNGPGEDFESYSNFSLVGANYTDSMVVPLPLSAVLFGSGLSLLGWVGRRKKR